MPKSVVLILLCCLLGPWALAQDSLPKLSVKNKSGKVILGWTNTYTDIVQINIQRSPDSLKGFKTILTVADPKAVTNGYLDSKPPDTRQFYRLYVQQEGGRYFFTGAYRPVLDTARAVPKPKQQAPVAKETARNNGSIPTPAAETAKDPGAWEEVAARKMIDRYGVVKKKLSNSRGLGPDSSQADAPSISQIATPSVYVFTNQQGHVVVALPQEKMNVYTLKFFKEDGTHLFTMNKIRDPQLTIDKTNFIKSGWFRFELFENDTLKEKNRFFIPRESF